MSELNDNVQQNKTSLIYKGFSLPHQINWLAKWNKYFILIKINDRSNGLHQKRKKSQYEKNVLFVALV